MIARIKGNFRRPDSSLRELHFLTKTNLVAVCPASLLFERNPQWLIKQEQADTFIAQAKWRLRRSGLNSQWLLMNHIESLSVESKMDEEVLQSLLNKRFGPKWHKPCRIDATGFQHKRHSWNLGQRFTDMFPRLAGVLEQSLTFDVTFRDDAPYERNLIAFWLATDGTPLMWMLEPPLSDTELMTQDSDVSSLITMWEHFGGFDAINSWYMYDRDLPAFALCFNALLHAPLLRLSKSDAMFYQDSCNDSKFAPRIEAMYHAGSDLAGAVLAVEPKTEHLFYLTNDGDNLSRLGAKVAAIGSYDTSVYTISNVRTPKELMETCAEHVLRQL